MRWAGSLGVCVLTSSFGCSHEQPPPQAPPPAPVVARAAPRRVEPKPGLPTDQIKRVVEARYSAIRGCHTVEYSGRDSTGGTVLVDLAIEPDGTVSAASIVQSDYDSNAFQECVLGVTRSLKFPEAEGGTELSWRFRFRAG